MNEIYDVLVIGGGVVGGTVLRELTKYRLRVALAERGSDVCMGQSRANSGIVHAGFDAKPGTLKAKFNVRGNELMYPLAEELGVKCVKNGSLVVAFSAEEEEALRTLLARGEQNGVKGLSILSREELLAREPNVSPAARSALYAPTGGIVCPYSLTIAAVGNAMDNGAALYLGFDVVNIKRGEYFTAAARDGRKISARLIVDCAGLSSGEIARLAGDESVRVHGRRGEYLLLDRECGAHVSHTMFFAPTEKGKGILVSPTADGNLLLGPTAEETEDGCTDTTAAGLAAVSEKAKIMCPSVPLGGTITSFAGVRAYSEEHDFILRESDRVRGLILCAGIESPGLTSAPAIAEYVAETLVGAHFPLEKNPSFRGKREPHDFKDLSAAEKNAKIKEDPRYGTVVCRCEQVTEGEIVRAIHENPPATTVDAVKRRTRAGMGRCQGGFCQPHVAEILARELGVPFEEVTKCGEGTKLVSGVTK